MVWCIPHIHTAYLWGKFGLILRNFELKLKFGIVTDLSVLNTTMKFTFSVFNRKNPIWTNSVQNINGGVIFFCFRPEKPFLGKFGPKNQNCLFKVNISTFSNSNMQNSMVMLIFSVFSRKNLFWANLVKKYQHC